VAHIQYKYLLDEVDSKDCRYSNLVVQMEMLVNNMRHYNDD
jgi:hypothetical protein